MKTQRRHELQTNVLADWLGHQIEQVKPYSKAILGVVVTVLLVAAVSAFMISEQTAKASVGWSEFFAASFDQDSTGLHEVAESHAGTEVSLWALLAEADLKQSQGLRSLFTNRDEALEHLKQAAAGYTAVKENPSSDPELKRAALFGLGQVHEAQSDLDAAAGYYEQVAGATTTGIGLEAKRRSELLKRAEVVKFYNWFEKQEPQPQMPAGGLPPGFNLPDLGDFPDLGDLPERPDLPIPSTVSTPETTNETSNETTNEPQAAEVAPDPETSSEDSAAGQESAAQPEPASDPTPEVKPPAPEESTPTGPSGPPANPNED